MVDKLYRESVRVLKSPDVIERFATKEEAVEILVQLKSGDRRAVVQATGSGSAPSAPAVVQATGTGSAPSAPAAVNPVVSRVSSSFASSMLVGTLSPIPAIPSLRICL